MCSAQYFGETLIGMPVFNGDIDHRAIESFGVHIDLDLAAAVRNGVEQCLPERITSLRNAALAMNAQRKPLNGRTGFQQQRQCVTAIRGMSFRCQPFHMMIGIRTVRPLVRMRPDPELTIKSSAGGLLGNEFQHLQILIPFRIAKRNNPHLVTRYFEKIRVREMKIIACYAARKIIAKTERKIESVKAIDARDP